MSRKYLRVDAAFAMPDLFDYLEANGFGYATWLRADKVLEFCIAYLLKRIPERLSNTIERHDAGDNLLHQGEGASAMTDGIVVHRCRFGRSLRRCGTVSGVRQNRRRMRHSWPKATKDGPKQATKHPETGKRSPR